MPTIATKNARIQYWKTGNGPVVILVQGAGVIGEGWRPQIDALKDRHTVVWIDNRGIGQSVFTTRPLSIEDMADDVLAVADAEGLWAFHLAGHSMGGLVARPDRASRVRPRPCRRDPRGEVRRVSRRRSRGHDSMR